MAKLTKEQKERNATSSTYNVFARKKGTKRWKGVGGFDWFTHDKPYQSCQKWVNKAKETHPEMEYEVRDLNGKVITFGRPPKGEGETKVVSARLNKIHLDVLEHYGKKGIHSDGIIKLIEGTNQYKMLVEEKNRGL